MNTTDTNNPSSQSEPRSEAGLIPSSAPLERGTWGEVVIGLDIGTGSIKAVAVDASFTVIASSQKFYPSSTQANEQDAESVWTAFIHCLQDLVQRLPHPPLAVALSAAMHSLMAVDEVGKPLMPALLWSHTRSAGIAQHLRTTALGKEIYTATGTPLHAMSPLCKLAWLRQAQPALFAAAHKFVSLKEWLWHRLFGEWVIDHSIASATGLFDVHHLQWFRPALDFASVTAEHLSTPVAVHHHNKNLRNEFANTIGLPPHTAFIIGASDGCLANLGSGCLRPHTAAITIGTSAAVRITSTAPLVDAERMLFNYRLDESRFVCGGATANGGNLLDWVAKNFLATTNESDLLNDTFATLTQIAPGSEGLLFLPYLHGERAPVWDEQSRGAFVGLAPAHTPLHLARAGTEGVCFALRAVLSVLEEKSGTVARIVFSGGASRSSFLAQLLADVTGKPVQVHQGADASATGAAFLAWETMGVANNEANHSAGETYTPVQQRTKVYNGLFPVYQQLYPALKASFHSLHQTRNT